MSNIVFLNGKNEVVTDSLMVAEVFGKKHHHVLDSVKEIISKSKNGKTNFRLSYYNAGTRQYPKYELNRDGFVMLIMGFTGDKAFEFKEMYINEFNRMEEKLKQMLTDSYLIDDPIARAEKWIKEQQEKQLLLVQNKELSEKIIEAKPKLDMYDAWLDVEGHCSIGEFARRVGLGRNTMFEKLRQMKILMDIGVNYNLPYQRHMKYFKVIDSVKGGRQYRVTVLNKQGCVWLHKKLHQEKEKLEPLELDYVADQKIGLN